MVPRDELEHYEATEAKDLTQLLHALRPPAREVQVPPPMDLTIRAAIWQAPVRRQLSMLLSMARQDLIQVIRQALTGNHLLEEVAPAENEPASLSEDHVPRLTASIDHMSDGVERYDSVWQACIPDGWDATDFPLQASEAPGSSQRPSGPPEAIVPDVTMLKVGDDYQVCLNEEGMPRLRLSSTYRRLMREGPWGESEATHDLDDKRRAAVWLIRSLEYRRQMLFTVAQSLVTRQRAFLDHGLAHLQPLALTEMAEALGLHASTVRRVITNKYLYTEQGLFELKYFFHSGFESYGAETMSSLTVKDRIKELVAAEDPAKPLTDQQLVEVLAAEQVKIARRTVTTYRRELNLPPAHRRQQYGSTAGASRLSPDEEQRVLLALQAFAQAAQAGATTSSSAVPFDILIRESPKMQEVSRLLERVRHNTATVLLTGERGTGKDLIARALHYQGPRAQGPFIAVNCAAIPETLLDAELFGDEHGTFIGATQRTPGCLELAAGGTLFLDKIDALSPALQAKLLRVLHEKWFTRVGGTAPLTTNARIVAATSQDLDRLMGEGRFRPDLYHRLNVFSIALPPLRECRQDLRALTLHFLSRYSHEGRKEVLGVSEEAMGWLARYPWPGNVWELEKVIGQAVARCQGPTITAQDLPQTLREPSRAPVRHVEAIQPPAGGIALAEVERSLIQQALEQSQRNKSQAAKLLGLSRTQLRTRMRHYGLD